MRAFDGPGGTRRKDSSLHLLATKSVDDQRPRTLRRADHRDVGVPAGQDSSSCLPGLSVPGGVRGKTRPAGKHRRARPLLPIRTWRPHQDCVGACECAGSPQGGIGLHDHRIGSVSQRQSRSSPAQPVPGWDRRRDAQEGPAVTRERSRHRRGRSPGCAQGDALAIGFRAYYRGE